MPTRVAVIIPALDEERSLPSVLAALSRVTMRAAGDGAPFELAKVLVVDNGSVDGTSRVARSASAAVILEPQRGCGRACLSGIAKLADDPPDIVVFLDADGSDDPAMLPVLVSPIARGEKDLVLGSRSMGDSEPGALLP